MVCEWDVVSVAEVVAEWVRDSRRWLWRAGGSCRSYSRTDVRDERRGRRERLKQNLSRRGCSRGCVGEEDEGEDNGEHHRCDAAAVR